MASLVTTGNLYPSIQLVYKWDYRQNHHKSSYHTQARKYPNQDSVILNACKDESPKICYTQEAKTYQSLENHNQRSNKLSYQFAVSLFNLSIKKLDTAYIIPSTVHSSPVSLQFDK